MNNFKAELDMIESQLQTAKNIESQLSDLVNQVYSKLEETFGPTDDFIKSINRQLRSILSARQ